jgi:AbrB family looped-hinge helix DNA binding protein
MAAPLSKTEVQLGPQGRVVIPARLRQALDLKPGDRLVARMVGDSIVLERPENMVKRMQERFAGVPACADLADELIVDRRNETKREQDK